MAGKRKTFQLQPSPIPIEPKRKYVRRPKRYEYKINTRKNYTEYILNKWGEEGWQVIDVHYPDPRSNEAYMTIYLMREIIG